MKMLFVILTILISVTLGQDRSQQQPSPVQTFAPAPGQTFSLDLDTAPGVYSNWQHRDLGSLSALRATLHIPVIRKDDKWAPSFSLWVQKSQAGQALDKVGVQFFALNRKTQLMIRVVQFEAGKLKT